MRNRILLFLSPRIVPDGRARLHRLDDAVQRRSTRGDNSFLDVRLSRGAFAAALALALGIGALGVMGGFLIMMILDVALW